MDTGDSCNSADGSGRVAPKTLFDFVDQHSIETLKNEVREPETLKDNKEICGDGVASGGSRWYRGDMEGWCPRGASMCTEHIAAIKDMGFQVARD